MPKYFEKEGLQVAFARAGGRWGWGLHYPQKALRVPCYQDERGSLLTFSGSGNRPLSIPFHFIIYLPPGDLRPPKHRPASERGGRGAVIPSPHLGGAWSGDGETLGTETQGWLSFATICELTKYLLCACSVLGTIPGQGYHTFLCSIHPFEGLFVPWTRAPDTLLDAGDAQPGL